MGILSTLAPYLLPGLLDRLEASSPRVELNVMESSGQELVAHLLAGRLDAAIVSLPLGLLELPERELFEDRFLLAGRARRLDALRAPGKAPQPADLARADIGPLLTLGDGHCLASQVLGACSMWRIQEVRRGAGSLATLSRLVANGAGLTLVAGIRGALRTGGRSRAELPPLRRAPSPRGSIGLAHRAVYHGQRWVDLLVEAASDAGQALVGEAREAICARSGKRRPRRTPPRSLAAVKA